MFLIFKLYNLEFKKSGDCWLNNRNNWDWQWVLILRQRSLNGKTNYRTKNKHSSVVFRKIWVRCDACADFLRYRIVFSLELEVYATIQLTMRTEKKEN